MILDKLLNNIIGFSITDITWIMAILFLIVYTIFAFIIVRQVSLLNRTLGTALSPWLRVIALGHLVASIIILLLAIVLI